MFICREAEPGQVLASESVRNALVGTGIEFTFQGEYELPAKPSTGPRRLYALAATSSLVRDESSEPADSVPASTATGRETFTNLDLNELAEDALNGSWTSPALYRAEAAGIRLTIDRGGEVPIFGEPTLLQRLLGQLLSNAIEFSPRKGHVHVIVDTAGSFGRVQVLDEGPGIPDNEREHFFERRRPGDVTGATTRLSFAASLAQANEGFIDIVDTPGWSTTFRVYIPLRRSAEEAGMHGRLLRRTEVDDVVTTAGEDGEYRESDESGYTESE